MTASRFALLLIFASSFATAVEPQWIWSTKEAATKAEKGDVLFRKAISVEGTAETASITLSADNAFDLFLNGRHVGSGEGWQQRQKFDVKPLLVPGRNIVAVRATNAGPDPAGLVVSVEIKPQGKDAVRVVSDATWKFSTALRGNWATPEFDDSKWDTAFALGEYGKTAPWGPAGAIVPGQATASAVAKGKNTERGLFEFKDGDRLVLLGSAFIERMQSNGYFELELISAHPEKNITIRNLGWSGDNVWGDARAVFGQRADGFKRLLSDVNLCNPSVILVCYGENEAYAGEAGLEEFRQGFNTLLDALEKTGARIVVATPRKHENVGKPFPDLTKYNADLRKYCDAMKEVAKERELTFVDWFDVWRNKVKITESGSNIIPFGYHRLAPLLVKSLGGLPAGWELRLNLNENEMEASGALITNVQTTPRSVSFTAQPSRLGARPLLATHYPLVFIKSVPDDPSFGEPSVVIDGLMPGDYELFRDAHGFGAERATKEKSWVINLEMNDYVKRELDLLAAINEKNFLFFNRYRPQNETYLFLFRKHEQGNNAVEIPQFDPLIAAQEKIIAELKKPPKQKFELKRVGD